MSRRCEENVRRTWQRMKEVTGKIKSKNKTFPKVLIINKKSIYSVERMYVLHLLQKLHQSQQISQNI